MQKEKLQNVQGGRDIGVDVPRLAPPSAQTGSKFHEVTYGDVGGSECRPTLTSVAAEDAFYSSKIMTSSL